MSLKKRFLTFIPALLILAACCGCAKRPAVHIQKSGSGEYRLIVAGHPFVIKGVCYNPIPIGKSHEYDWWSDPNKPWMADGRLMKAMGINTVRIYKAGGDVRAVRQVISDLYDHFGIRTVMGHWLGFWEYPCPLYGDRQFKDRVKKEVIEMVMAYKDEPGMLFWVLGNENNFSCFGHVNPWSSDEIDKEPDPQKQKAMRARAYYSFVNEIAAEIHKVDSQHPVALGNGELVGLEYAKDVCPQVDLVGCIIYRGKTFGNLFKSLKATFDRPVFIAEFGADCYDAFRKTEDQNMQAFFLESQWRQIYQNLAGNKNGEGNCLGGTIFEWTDEWWKHNEANPDGWTVHDTESNWTNGSYYYDILVPGGKNMNEEWFGIVALSPELEAGLNKRIPRKAYYVIREFWKKPVLEPHKRKKEKRK